MRIVKRFFFPLHNYSTWFCKKTSSKKYKYIYLCNYLHTYLLDKIKDFFPNQIIPVPRRPGLLASKLLPKAAEYRWSSSLLFSVCLHHFFIHTFSKSDSTELFKRRSSDDLSLLLLLAQDVHHVLRCYSCRVKQVWSYYTLRLLCFYNSWASGLNFCKNAALMIK